VQPQDMTLKWVTEEVVVIGRACLRRRSHVALRARNAVRAVFRAIAAVGAGCTSAGASAKRVLRRCTVRARSYRGASVAPCMLPAHSTRAGTRFRG